MNRIAFTRIMVVAVFFSATITHKVEFNRPSWFPEPSYRFDKNPLNESRIELGRKLFFDPILSADNSTSCSSCHSPYSAFAHTDHALSHGIHDQVGTRNAPALFNLAWQTSFMWDGAISHLDMQALAPISHPKEMGESIAHVVEKLQEDPSYRSFFHRAYGDSTVTGEYVLKALSQFQLTLVSSQSKYDGVINGTDSFTEQELKGYSLFKKNCNACHTEPLFSSYKFANNGLPVDTTLNDLGRWNITAQGSDSLMYKIPSLRNLSFTSPYMHDGRFRQLREVLNHYTDGIINSPTLSPELQQGISMASDEKTDLIAFLLTLNDTDFVFNPDHQFPRNLFTQNKN